MGNCALLEHQQDIPQKPQRQPPQESKTSRNFKDMTDEEYYEKWPKIDDEKIETIYKRLVRAYGWINIYIDCMDLHFMAACLEFQVAQLNHEDALFMLSLGETQTNYETVNFSPIKVCLERTGAEKTVKFVKDLKKNRSITNCDAESLLDLVEKKCIQFDQYGYVFDIINEYLNDDNKTILVGYYDQVSYDLQKIYKHPGCFFHSDCDEASELQ